MQMTPYVPNYCLFARRQQGDLHTLQQKVNCCLCYNRAPVVTVIDCKYRFVRNSYLRLSKLNFYITSLHLNANIIIVILAIMGILVEYLQALFVCLIILFYQNAINRII